MLQNTSIRRKQMLIIMLTSGVVLVLACAAISIFEVTAFRKDMVVDLSTLADIVGDNSSAALDFQDTNTATETLSRAAIQTRHHGRLHLHKSRRGLRPVCPRPMSILFLFLQPSPPRITLLRGGGHSLPPHCRQR